MSFTYAIGDLHGRLDVLDFILARLHEREEAGTIVFLGDYVDRGPDSKAVVERLMAGSQDHHKWVVLKGNHEEMAVVGSTTSLFPWWRDNGGQQTLESYGATFNENKQFIVEAKMPNDVLDWMAELPIHYLDKHRLYVHAGIKRGESWQGLNPEVLLWIRHHRGTEVPEPSGLHVVHGHTPYTDGPELLQSRTNLDTFSWKTGRAVVAMFDDDVAGGPVKTFETNCGYYTRSIGLDSSEDK
jgi:serine/threonine protein phosphatase 1